MKPILEIWTLHEKVGKERRWKPAYFCIHYGPEAQTETKDAAKYLNETSSQRKYKAVRYVPRGKP